MLMQYYSFRRFIAAGANGFNVGEIDFFLLITAKFLMLVCTARRQNAFLALKLPRFRDKSPRGADFLFVVG